MNTNLDEARVRDDLFRVDYIDKWLRDRYFTYTTHVKAIDVVPPCKNKANFQACVNLALKFLTIVHLIKAVREKVQNLFNLFHPRVQFYTAGVVLEIDAGIHHESPALHPVLFREGKSRIYTRVIPRQMSRFSEIPTHFVLRSCSIFLVCCPI